ncbi:MAG: hypothetical protein M0003_10345 [Acidithiobacillus sp.]|nr:hypothetical protein [Acidithiobacillus sp.]
MAQPVAINAVTPINVARTATAILPEVTILESDMESPGKARYLVGDGKVARRYVRDQIDPVQTMLNSEILVLIQWRLAVRLFEHQ